MSRARFLMNFVMSPRQVGSVTPSSRWLCRRLLHAADFNKAECIAEFGPGTACLTRRILALISPTASLFAFEINREFVDYLNKSVDHPRFMVVHDSAEHVERYLKEYGFTGADYIFSGLPFTTIPGRLKFRILRATYRVLKPGGKFIAYQYSLYLLRTLRAIFGDVKVCFEPRNIPPAFCFICTKHLPRRRRRRR